MRQARRQRCTPFMPSWRISRSTVQCATAGHRGADARTSSAGPTAIRAAQRWPAARRSPRRRHARAPLGSGGLPGAVGIAATWQPCSCSTAQTDSTPNPHSRMASVNAQISGGADLLPREGYRRLPQYSIRLAQPLVLRLQYLNLVGLCAADPGQAPASAWAWFTQRCSASGSCPAVS